MESKYYGIGKIISGYLSNTLTNEEEIILQQWLNEQDSNKKLLESLKKREEVQKDINFVSSVDIDLAWKNAEKLRRSSRVRYILRYTGYAAALLLVFSILFLWHRTDKGIKKEAIVSAGQYRSDVGPGGNIAQLVLSDGRKVFLGNDNTDVKEQDGTEITGTKGEISYVSQGNQAQDLLYNRLIVPKAGTYRIVLPDGTKVWVNALSQLRFPLRFSETERKVYLNGEAYFEVAKDIRKPFRVEIDESEIEVLGTHFNVSAYTTESATTLLEGSVVVRNKSWKKLLKPGQEALVSGSSITITNANIDKAIAWKEGDFYFKGDEITDIMEQLARWYDLEVEYNGNIPHKRFSGSISRNVNLSEVLDMLSYVSKASFEISERKVTVHFNKRREPMQTLD